MFVFASNVVIVNWLVALPAPNDTLAAPLRLYFSDVIVVGATPIETLAHPVICCAIPVVTVVGTLVKATVGDLLTIDSVKLPDATTPEYDPVAVTVNDPLAGAISWTWYPLAKVSV